MSIPFNRPYRTGDEPARVAEAIESGWTGGNGPFSRRAEALLEELTGAERVLLTHSCTGALEMAALLSEVGPGDEVVLPSFTFVSTANAFALRGAVPVFADVDPATLCLDPASVEAALGPRTRVVVPVHYAGVGCDMAALGELARAHDLLVVEDAAQAIDATWDGRALGTFGALGTLSFHETKNVSSGEGGALLLNEPRWIERAEVLQEKGTNRAQFSRSEVDRYTWVDVGSSFLMSDATAALLVGQLERVHAITEARREVWRRYHEGLRPLEERGVLRRPAVPEAARPNGHLYYVLLEDRATRDRVIAGLAERGIAAYFHYVPLHSSPAGRRLGRTPVPLDVTESVADRLVRLPLWVGLGEAEVDRVVTAVGDVLG